MSKGMKIDKSMPKPRNAMAVIARTKFRATSFDHKAEARGGTTNTVRDLIHDYFEEMYGE